ncbi:hypothetical protein M3649_14070 [Ureibacillus chungkukjangi]|uniref:hypothetical protein n=1 Tax=Ureibacillus chungkukjangi TaxID=1202712 RepID=UPI00203D5327|nr:hypothetical protein [Ureibacillus chungkukjangi]MCM3389262.1 hypothetical protein [Ureibacillus chungkukjangi]
MKKYLPYRPVLYLPKTKSERVMDIIGITLFLGAILFVGVNWGNIPESIPAISILKGR